MNNVPAKPRVLLSTIMPSRGGVDTMTAFAAQTLKQHGLEPVIAYYQPYSQSPELSVPSFKLLRGRVGHVQQSAYDGCESHAIGCWLPELEFTHYRPTRHWRKLIDSCQAYLSVSGNVLAASAFWLSHKPFVSWVATDWNGDRKDRVKGFPWARSLLDRYLNARVIQRLERKLLRQGHILALSEHTARQLSQISVSHRAAGILPMPVDSVRFQPDPTAVVPGRIGFLGRLDDPRKNVDLLLQATSMLRDAGQSVTVLLIGGRPNPQFDMQLAKLGLADLVRFLPDVSDAELPGLLQTLDVFVLPSYQEGLCIAALEAMACGAPVVSTRCGGPEEFVIPDQTGSLVDFDASQMATAIQAIVGNRNKRQMMSQQARQLILSRYDREQAQSILMDALKQEFPQLNITTGAIQ